MRGLEQAKSIWKSRAIFHKKLDSDWTIKDEIEFKSVLHKSIFHLIADQILIC